MRASRFIIVFGFLAVVTLSDFLFGASQTENSMQNQILFKGGMIDSAIEPPKVIPSSLLSFLTDRKIYLIIQFRELIDEKTKDEIGKLGVEFMTYIPNRAFVIRTTERFLPILSSFKTVQWIGDYTERFKIDPQLLKNSAVPNAVIDVPPNEEQKITIVIKLFQGETAAGLKHFLEEQQGHGPQGRHPQGEILYNERNMVKASVPRRLIQPIARRSEVEWIEEAKSPQLLNYIVDGEGVRGDYQDLTGFESGVKILNPDGVYQLGLHGNGQIIAVADTGVDVGTVDQTLSLDFQNRIFKGYALGFWRESWSDEHGHGTHVSGSILGNGAYSSGLLSGVASESQLIMQSLMGGLKTLDIPLDLTDLFDPVYEDGARIHSDSWGHPAFDYEQTANGVDKYMWNHPDFLVVVAAGNNGVDMDKDGLIDSTSLLSPAIAKNPVTVGASENVVLTGGVQKPWGQFRGGDKIWGAEPISSDKPSDNPNGIAAFSSRGPTADGRLKPDVVVPGTNILSARTHVPGSEKLWGEYNEHYLWSGGTSMAAPLASGAAALVRQFYVEHHRLPFVSAALVKATLMNGADDLYPGQFGFGKVMEIPSQRPNIHEGWGRLNLEKTLIFKNRTLRFFDETVGLSTKQKKTYSVKVVDPSQPLKVTLVYTDYPGAESAQKALVNDLDLTVEAPNPARRYFPNGRQSADRLNNVEGIDILTPEVGIYSVTVFGYHVPNGKKGAQPYALVITGG